MITRNVAIGLTATVIAVAGFARPAAGQDVTKSDLIAWWNEAFKLQSAGEQAKAAVLYERILPYAPQLLGAESEDFALLMNNLGDANRALGKYAAAETLLKRSLVIYEARLGEKPMTATVLNNLASLYHITSRYTEAEPLHKRSLTIREDSFGKDHPETAVALNGLGGLYFATGRYAESEPLYLRALTIRESKLGLNHPATAQTVNNLAGLCHTTGRYGEAEKLYLRLLSAYEAKPASNPLDMGLALNNLAELYRSMGRYTEAEPLLKRSLSIYETRLGKSHPETATPLGNLAGLYGDTGRYAEAEPLFKRTLAIREEALGKDHPDTAITLNNLAFLYMATKKYAEAEPLFKRAVAVCEAKKGKDSPETASFVDNLARLYHQMPGRDAEALAMFQRALAIREAKWGQKHPDTGHSLNNLGLFYFDAARYAEAEPLFKRALAIYEATLGKDHHAVAGVLNNLALLYHATDRFADAAEAIDRARHVTRRHVGRVLPVLSEKEQIAFFRIIDERQLYRAFTLAVRQPDVADLTKRGATWLLNSKGLAQQTLAQSNLAARAGRDPAVAAAVRELLDARRELARLNQNPPKPGQEDAHARRKEEVDAREQELSKRLQQTGAAPDVGDPWVDLDAVRQALPAKSAFVDVARFDEYDPKVDRDHRKLAARYAAWVTPKDGPVRVVDLGPAAAIDAAVAAARKAIDDAPDRLKAVGEPAAEAEARGPLAALAKLVLDPLRPHLDAAETWVICPDGQLWLAPWVALPLDDKTYALERHTIRLVVSGRDLLPRPAPGKPPTAPAVFADPDFDAPPPPLTLSGKTCHGSLGNLPMDYEFAEGGVVRIRNPAMGGVVIGVGTWVVDGDAVTFATKIARYTGRRVGTAVRGERVLANPGTAPAKDSWSFDLPNAPPPGQTRGLGGLKLGRVLRLAGAAAEGEAAAEQLGTLTGAKPAVFTDEKATTAAFRALDRPRVLTLSTHGFFLPEQELSAADKERLARDPAYKPADRIEDPLLRCGLLLAGCNRPSALDAGVLTGREVLSADLRGTQLVVLSACETGLGDVRNGEGVAGLRQAFLLAGAESVLATLWQVPDLDTTLLVTGVYDALGKGDGRAAALRKAQAARIAARRQKFGAAHPYYWAAFTVTGDADPLGR